MVQIQEHTPKNHVVKRDRLHAQTLSTILNSIVYISLLGAEGKGKRTRECYAAFLSLNVSGLW